jgi:hypothetical protein
MQLMGWRAPISLLSKLNICQFCHHELWLLFVRLLQTFYFQAEVVTNEAEDFSGFQSDVISSDEL